MQRMNSSGLKVIGWGVSIGAMLAFAGTSHAQPPSTTGAAATPSTGIPAKDNLLKMQRSLTLDVTERPLKEVITWIADQTKAQLEPLWKTDASPDNLDPEALISINVKDMNALILLDKVLALGAQNIEAGATWQFTEYGSIELGLRPSLNKHRRVQIYDINDLLLVLPIYDQVPTIDLSQVLQSSGGGKGGGGGGQSPFSNTTNSNNTQRTKERETQRQDRSKEIIEIIQAIAEPNQWINGGGDVPAPRYFQGHIIVDAPDYMHRALNGYPWWPVTSFSSSSGGRRYVSMNGDSSVNKIDNIRTQPVTATTGGSPAPLPGGGGR